MSISHEVMQKQLSDRGFHLRGTTTKVTEYSKFDCVVYTENTSKHPKMVLSPNLAGHLETIQALPGVVGLKNGKFFHNSNLKKYPLRRNRGKTDIHYGLAFSFDSTVSLDRFIDELICI